MTMKPTISVILALVLITILVASCEQNSPIATSGTAGSIDLSSYVSIGNSLTAGYQSGALYQSSQKYSYPSLIAAQMAKVSPGAQFTQPLLNDPGVGGRMRISKIAVPPSITIDPSLDPNNPATYVDPTLPAIGYHNLGIPGAAVVDPRNLQNDVLDTLNSFAKSYGFGLAAANPFYHLVRRNPANGQPGNPGSVYQQAKLLKPTIMTVWLGNNDILGYATKGADPGYATYTDPAKFSTVYHAMIDSLKTIGAKLVLATIPDVTSIPFCSTLPYFMPDPSDITKPFSGTPIPLLAVKSGGVVGYLGPHDMVLLTAADSLGVGYGLPAFASASGYAHAGQPLANRFILDSSEVALCRSVVGQFNSVINSYASDPNIAVVDFNGIFNDIAKNGYTVAGQTFTAAYVSGGLFGLDGVHPTSQAYGIIANFYIRTMNAKWGASVPFVDVTSLPGLPIPLNKREAGLPLSSIPSKYIEQAIRVWQ
jgi:hypothetical protein